MYKIAYRLLLFVWMLSFIGGCQRNQNSKKERAFSERFPGVEMNSSIQFWDPAKYGGSFTIGKSIDLVLETNSTNKIVFPSDYGIRIFMYDSEREEWLEIQNKAKYFPPGNRQISPKGEDNPGLITIGLAPALQPGEKPVKVRVVVIGTVYHGEQKTDQEVGAYIDVEMSP